jgi:zinc transport system substrate-binding protein
LKFIFYLILLTIASALPVTLVSAAVTPSNSTISMNSSGITSNTNQSRIKIVASFYPIYEFVKKVGGNKVDVTTLIPIGVEPHDFEPTIQQIQNAESADMIVYNGAGLEKWIDKINSKSKVDASQGLNLIRGNNSESAGSYDPHVWLDPILAEKEVGTIRDALMKVDPSNSNYYKTNADNFLKELANLDNKIKTELTVCSKKDFIAFHNAFTYFADRYGLKQHSIQGLSPEGEILPQKIQQIIQLSRDLGLNIIYSEDLIDPRSAQVIAQEIPNGKVLVLSPIEGINAQEQKAGIGYLDKMNEDIENLKIGLQCHPK